MDRSLQTAWDYTNNDSDPKTFVTEAKSKLGCMRIARATHGDARGCDAGDWLP
jgi:hypothetical protein